MNLVTCFLCRLSWRKITGLCALILWLGGMGSLLMAEGTNAAPTPVPASSAPVSAGDEDFGQYLVDHQADLAPFFSKHLDELIKEGVPVLLGLLGRITFLALLASWAIDVLLSRCFSSFFAPIYAKVKRAFIYATGGLVISVIFLILLGLGIVISVGLPQAGIIILVLIGISLLGSLAAQTAWIVYLYRTNVMTSAGFALVVLLVHIVTGIMVSAPLLGSRAANLATEFVDQSVTPKLQVELDAAKHELVTVQSERDELKTKMDDAMNRLAAANAEQMDLQKKIEERKNSETYIFSQIMKVHATGDLTTARRQLTDFLVKFPAGSMTDAAKAQAAMIDNELAAQEAQKKQNEADAVRAAALARADLLARAGKGEVTLSEMRQALFGKTPAEVSALFGPPAETGSNRWGFAQRMINNPLTNEKFGLAIYFANGTVQGVDYYYGTGGGK